MNLFNAQYSNYLTSWWVTIHASDLATATKLAKAKASMNHRRGWTLERVEARNGTH